MQGKATVPNFATASCTAAGISASNYQHYEVYYVDASKKEVCIGTVSLSAPPSAKEKVDLNLDMLIPNANFAAFETWVKTLSPTKSVKFVVKAVTKDASGLTVNWSAGGSSSVRAGYFAY
jgi:hypothetical protein